MIVGVVLGVACLISLIFRREREDHRPAPYGNTCDAPYGIPPPAPDTSPLPPPGAGLLGSEIRTLSFVPSKPGSSGATAPSRRREQELAGETGTGSGETGHMSGVKVDYKHAIIHGVPRLLSGRHRLPRDLRGLPATSLNALTHAVGGALPTIPQPAPRTEPVPLPGT